MNFFILQKWTFKMLTLSLLISPVLLILHPATANVEYCDIYPPQVAQCFKDAQYHPVNPMQANVACVRQFYLDLEPDLNITAEDRIFFDQRVQNKYAMGPPPTGFRIRKEYRRLAKEERIRLHIAFNELYKHGILQKFGRLHATATNSIHRGASFLAWHRIFIADVEEELRRVDPTVSLPYWDSTMDNNMTLPSESVMWSPCFFGNGNGSITTGPFRGWYGGRSGPIMRDFARSACNNGRLLNKNDIIRILGKCRLQEITSPPDAGPCNLEILHDGIHDWVGGDMGDLFLSAFDPVFYFHHAFIDYIWELFRRNQKLNCGIDPETDYPPDHLSAIRGRVGHTAFDRMYGYEHLRNVDALSHIFIKKFYKYETLPQCPDCGSEFLYCDPIKQMCISKDKSSCDIAPGQNSYTGSGFDNVRVGFSGRVASEFHDWPIKHPISIVPTSDPRHRDMTHEEALRVMGESGPFGFGPASFPVPSASSMLGHSQYDAMFSPLKWPYELQSSAAHSMYAATPLPGYVASPAYLPFSPAKMSMIGIRESGAPSMGLPLVPVKKKYY